MASVLLLTLGGGLWPAALIAALTIAVGVWLNRRIPKAPEEIDIYEVAAQQMFRPWRPTRAEIDATLASLAKAYPYLEQHASHLDGEFDNALTKTRRMFDALLAQLDGE